MRNWLLKLLLRRLEKRVGVWIVDRFGGPLFWSREERALRVLEEALELAQASGVPAIKAHRLSYRVYGRPLGDLDVEVSQIGLCLLAYCASQNIGFGDVLLAEMTKIEGLSREYFQERYAAKIAAGVTADLGG